jgi:hypothetical protein
MANMKDEFPKIADILRHERDQTWPIKLKMHQGKRSWLYWAVLM